MANFTPFTLTTVFRNFVSGRLQSRFRYTLCDPPHASGLVRRPGAHNACYVQRSQVRDSTVFCNAQTLCRQPARVVRNKSRGGAGGLPGSPNAFDAAVVGMVSPPTATGLINPWRLVLCPCSISDTAR